MAAPKQYRIRTRLNRDRSTTFYARFTDQHGIRREFPLGRTPDWTSKRAEREIEHIKADVERGIWSPRSDRAADPQRLLFSDMAYDWWGNKIVGQKAVSTQEDYRLVLDKHLLPRFGAMPVASISKYSVDQFTESQRKAGLSASYINSQLQILGQILDLALDWYDDILPANPARGKQRRVQEPKRSKTEERARWLTADHVELLLHAARLLEEEAPRDAFRRLGRESLLACLCFSGVRNTELCELTWADVDFTRSIIVVPGTKTGAADREVTIVAGLVRLLEAHRESTRFPRSSDPVWATANGTHRDKDNLNQRIMRPVVAKARELIKEDERRAEEGEPRRLDVVLPSRVTPHTFRRTFCSFAVEESKDPFYVQGQMGHEDAAFTLRVYNIVRQRSGARDPRVLAWMERPKDETPEPRVRLGAA